MAAHPAISVLDYSYHQDRRVQLQREWIAWLVLDAIAAVNNVPNNKKEGFQVRGNVKKYMHPNRPKKGGIDLELTCCRRGDNGSWSPFHFFQEKCEVRRNADLTSCIMEGMYLHSRR